MIDSKSETVEIDFMGDLTQEEGEMLIGKKISKVISTEYALKLIFTDDTELEISGHTYSDCSLSVDLNIEK